MYKQTNACIRKRKKIISSTTTTTSTAKKTLQQFRNAIKFYLLIFFNFLIFHHFFETANSNKIALEAFFCLSCCYSFYRNNNDWNVHYMHSQIYRFGLSACLFTMVLYNMHSTSSKWVLNVQLKYCIFKYYFTIKLIWKKSVCIYSICVFHSYYHIFFSLLNPYLP